MSNLATTSVNKAESMDKGVVTQRAKKDWGFPDYPGLVKIIAPMEYKRNIVREIEKVGYIEPIEIDPRPGVDQLELENRRNTFESLKSDFQVIVTKLRTYLKDDPPRQKLTVPSIELEVQKFANKVKDEKGTEVESLFKQETEIQKELSDLRTVLSLLQKIEAVGLESDSETVSTLTSKVQSNYTKVFIGSVFGEQIKTLNSIMIDLTDGAFVLRYSDEDKKTGEVFFILICLASDEEVVELKLKEFNYQPFKIPENIELTQTLDAKSFESEISILENKLEVILDEIKSFGDSNLNLFLSALEACDIETQRIALENKMKRTKTNIVVWGWIPPENVNSFTTKVDEVSKGSAIVEYKEAAFDKKYVPSLTRDKKYLPPVRGLVSSFGHPSHEEIDPFPLVAILFPVFFGIMFADVVDGLVLALIGYIFVRKKRKKDVIPTEGFSAYLYGGAELLVWMGLVSAFMGLVFGSFGGDETILWSVPVLPQIFGGGWRWLYSIVPAHGAEEVSRNYVNILILSIVMAAITILLGLVIKVYQKRKYGHSKYEYYAPIAQITLFLGAGLIFFTSSFVQYFFMAVVGLALFFLIYFEAKAHGFDGAMQGVEHFIGLLSNTLSFSRLLAMNTVHFVLRILPYIFLDLFLQSHTVNHYVGEWGQNVVGSGSLTWWIVGLIIGTIIVVPVETVFSSLQALRLTWVEFYGKFYSGNGVPFSPYSVKRLYTVEE